MPSSLRHMCLDVRGYLKNAKKCDYKGMFKHDDGRTMTPDEAKDELLNELAKGHLVIPFGKPCEGFDYSGGGCPGHTIRDSVDAAIANGAPVKDKG